MCLCHFDGTLQRSLAEVSSRIDPNVVLMHFQIVRASLPVEPFVILSF